MLHHEAGACHGILGEFPARLHIHRKDLSRNTNTLSRYFLKMENIEKTKLNSIE